MKKFVLHTANIALPRDTSIQHFSNSDSSGPQNWSRCYITKSNYL